MKTLIEAIVAYFIVYFLTVYLSIVAAPLMVFVAIMGAVPLALFYMFAVMDGESIGPLHRTFMFVSAVSLLVSLGRLELTDCSLKEPVCTTSLFGR